MKPHTRHLTATLLLTATPFATLSCKKEESAKAPAGSSAEQSESAAAAAPDAALEASAWGFAAKLPKNTEGFMAFYNTGSLVEGLLGSKWFAKVKANKAFGAQVEAALSQMQADPQAKEVLALVKEIAGKEAVFVLAEGFTSNVAKLAEGFGPMLTEAVKAGVQRSVKQAAEGADAPVPPSPNPLMALIQATTPEQRQQMIDQITSAEFPPVLAAFKAGGARQKIDGLMKQALGAMPPEVKATTEAGSYKVDGQEFQTLTFKVSKIPRSPESKAKSLEIETAFLGDAAKAKKADELISAKTLEASWGWVGDYLVLSLGKDHSHVKLATGADSVLGLKEISAHAAAWQAKKPFAFGFLNQGTIRALNASSVFDGLAMVLESSGAELPIPVAPVVADLKKLAARSHELWPNDADAVTTAAWWDGGIQAESFGGAKPRAFDSSKPLSFSALAGPATLFSSASRVNEAESDKTFAFFEETCATLWESYQKNIKPALPKETAAKTGMAEALGIPMIKGLWKGVQDFRGALGSESGMIVNLDGTMPPLPNLPPEMKDAKIPRILYASELKDPAKLSAAWKGFGDLIGSIIALSKAPVNPKPTEKKDGDLTTWGWDLPMDLGDTWPHAAVSGSRWFFGSSPTLTKSAAAMAPATAGPAAGAMMRVNFSALWPYASTMLRLSPSNTPETLEAASGVIELLGAVSELTATTGESEGAAHTRLHLRISDSK